MQNLAESGKPKEITLLGNWKAHKTYAQAKQWIDDFSRELPSSLQGLCIIVCPAFHHLPLFAAANVPVTVGLQDMSQFPDGAYTGEITAGMAQGMATVALIGHSERRTHMAETDEVVCKKAAQAIAAGIGPIVCVSDVNQARALAGAVPDFALHGRILYEPLSAIGSGQADSPEHANTAAAQIRDILGDVPILYGGSVVPDNARSFVSQEHIAGIGVGGASLDAQQFVRILTAVFSIYHEHTTEQV